MSYSKVPSVDQLRTLCSQGPFDAYIQLTCAISRKTIQYRQGTKKPWRITNHIDDTKQSLTEKEFASRDHSNIYEAIQKGAFYVSDEVDE